MCYLSYFEGIAQVRELTGLPHVAEPLINLHKMLSSGQFAILDIGSKRSADHRAHRAIFVHGMCFIKTISFRDCASTNLRSDGIRLQGGPIDIPDVGSMPSIVLGSVECIADSTETALNFARPFRTSLEVRSANAGEADFVLLFAIEYEGRLLRCKSQPVHVQLRGRHQFLEFDVPEVTTVDPEVAGFLEAATFVQLCSVFFALGTELENGQVALHSNWAFSFLPANYVL